MSQYRVSETSTDWECGQCARQLEIGRVVIAYMKTRFTVELFKCPSCGMVWVSEALALGKMKEAEIALEDK